MADPYAAYEVTRVRDFNPDTGPSFVITFAGTETKMNEIAAYYEEAGLGAPLGYGYKTTFHKTAAGIILVVRIPDEILYTTRWNLETEITQVPIWWLEKLRDYIPELAEIDLVDDPTGANLRKFIWRVNVINRAANAIRAGTSERSIYTAATPPAGTADAGPISTEELNVILQIVREGGEFTDWKRPVLKRCRVIPVGLFDVRTRLVGPPQLYSLDGIYNLFGLTNDLYDQAVTVYDHLPTAFPNTRWSWKIRRDDSDTLVGSGKVTETRDFVFGRWSTITNTFIS